MRSAIINEARLLAPPGLEAASVNQVEGGLEFIRQHFASLASRKGLINNDLIGVFANPKIRRFFSDEAPKKKSMFAKSLNFLE